MFLSFPPLILLLAAQAHHVHVIPIREAGARGSQLGPGADGGCVTILGPSLQPVFFMVSRGIVYTCLRLQLSIFLTNAGSYSLHM